jgi:hypothetical protein
MKRAALGVVMHSGWGVLVAISRDADGLELLDRRRIVVADPEAPGAIQPYHHAAHLQLPESEKHLARCVAASTSLASVALSEVIRELSERHYRVVGCAVLLASGRTLPPLEKILAAHPLIHTAEGEFFRRTVILACESLKIPMSAIRERDLEERGRIAFGKTASRLQQDVATLGSTVGPPWTRDHKAAAFAGLLLLQP